MGEAPSVSVLLVRPLALLASGLAGGLPSFLGQSDITAEILADGDARLGPRQFQSAWSEIVRSTRDSAIALTLAHMVPEGAFGLVEYVCRASPTVGEALKQWSRYLRILNDDVEVGLVEEGGQIRLRVLRDSAYPAPASHELCFALVASQIKRLANPPVIPTEIRFGHRAPENVEPYARWFGAKVSFLTEHTEIVFERAAIESKLATADPALHILLKKYADTERERPSAPPLSTQVKRVLGETLRADAATIEEAASRLGMTPRSLQRRLKEEETSFQTLREEVRRELSTRYLASDLSIAEISFMLGFSEPSAFFRAHKRWTGLTPIESRSRLRAGDH